MGFSLRRLELDAETIVIGLMIFAALRNRTWFPYEPPPKGGKGSGPGSTSSTSPAAGSLVWSEDTMRLFLREMAHVPIDAKMVLLAIASASNFNADEYLGNHVGLLMVRRDDLSALGYPGVPKFEEIDAPHQIPWIARVIAYRVASSGAPAPATVPELAVLLAQPSNPTVATMLRNEAARRAEVSAQSSLYLEHENLMRHVIAVDAGLPSTH